MEVTDVDLNKVKLDEVLSAFIKNNFEELGVILIKDNHHMLKKFTKNGINFTLGSLS